MEMEGRFSITGIQGKNFGVRSLKKEGYIAFRSNLQSFEYAGFWGVPSYHEPDPTKPVTFRMRKEGDMPEPMIQRGPTLLGARNDGSSDLTSNLTTGRKASKRRRTIIALRISKGPKTNKRFDWVATI